MQTAKAATQHQQQQPRLRSTFLFDLISMETEFTFTSVADISLIFLRRFLSAWVSV
jgi:hypothetical protein